MAYTAQTVDDSRPAENRLTPQRMTCLKLSVSTSAARKLIPRDIKGGSLYCAIACWVRLDLVTEDPGSSGKTISDTSKDNILRVPAGTFVPLQETEFNCITAITPTGSDTLYIYPGYGSGLNGLVAEDLQA